MDSMAQAREFFMTGLAHYEAGRFEEADRQFAAALSLAPGRPSVLLNLGATRMKLAKFQEAHDLLAEAVAKEPDNSRAWGHLATALAELGQRDAALVAVDRSLALDVSQGIAWSLRGTLLRELGRHADAAQAFRQSLAHGGDAELNAYYLASLEDGQPPAAPPRGYVEDLFDGYAEGFEQHLRQVLRYRAPEILVGRLRQPARVFGHVLDLGCGTGVCGPLLRPLARRLQGLDLSANMVGQARQQGAYDDVVQADATQYLRAGGRQWDAIVAADVFVYLGALDDVLAAAALALLPGGVLCFTVEKEERADYALRTSLRYAHSAAYVERLAQQQGLAVQACEEHPIREDQGVPIAGLYYWLTRP